MKLMMMALAMAGAALSTAPAQAEDWSTFHVKVNVPFPFQAGKTAMPAGDYTIAQENGSGLLMIEGPKIAILVITHAGSWNDASSAPAVGFERSATGATLKEVRVGGHATSILPEQQ